MLCLDGTLCAESDLMTLGMFVGTACLECRKKGAFSICIVQSGPYISAKYRLLQLMPLSYCKILKYEYTFFS